MTIINYVRKLNLFREKKMSLLLSFYLRIIQLSYRFHDDDQPLENHYALFRIYIIFKHFSKDKWKTFFGDVDPTHSEDSDYEDCKLESH